MNTWIKLFRPAASFLSVLEEGGIEMETGYDPTMFVAMIILVVVGTIGVTGIIIVWIKIWPKIISILWHKK